MQRIHKNQADYTINNLYDLVKKGKLNTNPEYQRDYVYDDKKASSLVESALMGIPLPTIYLCEENDGKYSVIDGQQRITSFIRFKDGQFELKGLKACSELNGKKYSALDEEKQSIIDQTSFRTIIIEKDSSGTKYDIFERLNTGAVTLKPQELRNCVYRGPLNTLLHKLSKDKHVEELFITPNKRMQYQELILRGLALRNYQTYKPGMKSFLNKYMEENKNESEDKIEADKEFILGTLKTIKSVLGLEAFCNVNEFGKKERKKFSSTFYDSILIAFQNRDSNKLIRNADEIRKRIDWIKIKDNDRDYFDACNASTGNTVKVLTRIKKIEKILDDVLSYGGYEKERRAFNSDEKIELWNKQKHICALCGQEILSLDDAEVDHIHPYSKGGATEMVNAQLVHIKCNREKSARMTTSIFSLLDTDENKKNIYTLADKGKIELKFKKPELFVFYDKEIPVSTNKEMFSAFYKSVYELKQNDMEKLAATRFTLSGSGKNYMVSSSPDGIGDPFKLSDTCYCERWMDNNSKIKVMKKLCEMFNIDKSKIKIVLCSDDSDDE